MMKQLIIAQYELHLLHFCTTYRKMSLLLNSNSKICKFHTFMHKTDFVNKTEKLALMEGEKNFEKRKDKSSAHCFCNVHKLQDFF